MSFQKIERLITRAANMKALQQFDLTIEGLIYDWIRFYFF
jgi:hypothetical protein